MIKTVPNQRVGILHKAISNEGNPFTIINIRSFDKASKELSGNELKVYWSLVSNKDGYEWAISPEAISQRTGIEKREVQKKIVSLIEKGYLVQDKKQSNRYHVYEYKEDSCDESTVKSTATTSCMGEITTQACEKIPCQHGENCHNTMVDNHAEIEIIKRNSTLDIIETEQPNDLIPQELKDRVYDLQKQGYKYNKNNPQIQNLTGLNGAQIFRIIDEYKKKEDDERKKREEERVLQSISKLEPAVDMAALYHTREPRELSLELEELW